MVPLTIVMAPPTRVFEDNSVNREMCKVDAHYISRTLGSATDADIIFSAVRFTADMIGINS